MGLFSNMYTKEGPGVPKDAPKKKGAARFFEILGRDFGMLWRTTMLTTLCFLPCILAVAFGMIFSEFLGMVLIACVVYVLGSLLAGPALCGMHAVFVTTLRDEPCYMMTVYKKAWKQNWRQSMPTGVLTMVLLGIEVYTAYYCLANGPQYVMLGICMLCLLTVTTCSVLVFLQILFIDLPLGGMLKNSLLMFFGYAKRTLPAGLILLGVTLALALFVPVPFMPLVFLLGLPGFIGLIGDMWLWQPMESAFHITELQEQARREKEAQEAQEA